MQVSTVVVLYPAKHLSLLPFSTVSAGPLREVVILMRTKTWIWTITSCLEWEKLEEVCPLPHCVVSMYVDIHAWKS